MPLPFPSPMPAPDAAALAGQESMLRCLRDQPPALDMTLACSYVGGQAEAWWRAAEAVSFYAALAAVGWGLAALLLVALAVVWARGRRVPVA